MVKNKLIELKNIVKSYDGEIAVDHMNLYIRENEFITLVGPSGCGKTTTLRMIGGFEKPDEGEIIMNGQVVNDLPPHKRPINTVFQKYALFPHLNVYGNVAFGLNNRTYQELIDFYTIDIVNKKVEELYPKKNINQNPPINYKDLPTKEDIKNSLKYANPVMRAVILFMSSSGCARRETLNITIQDFIDATKEYHNSNNIYDVLNELKDNDSIIPTFKIHRQKTNKHYYTFCSPEATTEIFYYLSNIDKELKNEDKLFKIGQYY